MLGFPGLPLKGSYKADIEPYKGYMRLCFGSRLGFDVVPRASKVLNQGICSKSCRGSKYDLGYVA